MTPTEQKIYDIIVEHIKKEGYAPANTSIAKQIGKSRQLVDLMVNSIVDKGELVKKRKGLIDLP